MTDYCARPQLLSLLLSSPLVPTLVALPLFVTASAFKILFKEGSISISSTCPQPPPTGFFGSRPGRFHWLMWGSFMIMVPIS